MKFKLLIIFYWILNVVAWGQHKNGRYFQSINGTSWQSESFIDSSNFTTKNEFYLSLVETDLDAIKHNRILWTFNNKLKIERYNEVLKRHELLFECAYEIDENSHTLTLKKNNESVKYSYVSVSTGAMIGFKKIKTGKVRDTNIVDTVYHRNGKIQRIMEMDSLFRGIGIYSEYDSTGILRIEGKYAQMDSTGCVNCYDGYTGIDRSDPGKWTKANRIDVDYIMVGEWKYFHPNGQLAAIGRYDTLFNIYSGNFGFNVINQPVNVYIAKEQLKFGIWKYYDVTGKLIRQEEYYGGALVYKIDAE